MLKNIKIAHKVYLLALFGAFLGLGLAVGSVYSITEVGNKLKQIAEEDIPLTKAVSKVTIHQLE